MRFKSGHREGIVNCIKYCTKDRNEHHEPGHVLGPRLQVAHSQVKAATGIKNDTGKYHKNDSDLYYGNSEKGVALWNFHLVSIY